VLSLCREVRENAVPLVDAFNYPDWILKSPLGRYDGNIYEHYFETILKATHWNGSVVSYWDTEVKPLLNSKL
jgi:acyl-CoA oxidase